MFMKTMAAVKTVLSIIHLLLLCALLVVAQKSEVGTCGTDGCPCIGIDDVPEIQQLTELKISEKYTSVRIIEQIGRDYMSLGICLLNDKSGSMISEIEDDHHRTERRVREILRRWIQGKGQVDGDKKSNTWGRFIECLKIAKLMALVENIELVLCKENNVQQKPNNNQGGIRQALSEKSKLEKIMYGDAEKRQFIKEKKPLPSPKRGSKVHEQLEKYCKEVILIIHTVNDNEKWAALVNMEPPKIEDDDGELLQRPIDLFEANWIVLGEFGGYKAALIQTEMGVNAHDELLDALDTFPNAKYAIAVGVAGATSSKAELCDVLVSKWIDGVSNMKFSKDDNIIFRASDSRFTPTLQRLRNIFARGTETWIATDDFNCTKEGRKPKIFPGSLISSSVLMDNQKLRDDFVANNPEAVGIEMEGFKLIEIQNRKETREQRNFGVIVIKGVSDLGDGTKSKEWQFTAAMAAASYARHKLEETNGFLADESAA